MCFVHIKILILKRIIRLWTTSLDLICQNADSVSYYYNVIVIIQFTFLVGENYNLPIYSHFYKEKKTAEMNHQGYVAAPPYSQAQPGMGGFSSGFGQTVSSPLHGHYNDPNPAPFTSQSGTVTSCCILVLSRNNGLYFPDSQPGQCLRGILDV